MEGILAALFAVVSRNIVKLFGSKKRLSGSEVVVYGAIAFLIVSYCGSWFWKDLVATLALSGLRPYPDVFYQVYSERELALGPILVAMLVYSFLVTLLWTRCWPEGMAEDERLNRTLAILRRYRSAMYIFLAVDLMYIAVRWGKWLCQLG